MAAAPEREDSKHEAIASSPDGTGSSASVEPVAGESPAPAEPAPVPRSESSPAPESPTGDEAAEPAPDESHPSGTATEQLSLPGMPEAPTSTSLETGAEHDVLDHDPHHDDPHHHEHDYDQYHDEYHQEPYHDHHAGEHQDGYHHDDYHHGPDDPYHSEAHTAGGLATAAASTAVTRRRRPESADDPEEPEEEYGGPVKPFLDHLEDLRWMLIKCVVAMLLAMLACMVGAKYLVAVLMWPLDQAESLSLTQRTDVPIFVGKNQVGRMQIEDLGRLGWDTNSPALRGRRALLRMTPQQFGTNVVMTLQPSQKTTQEGAGSVMVMLKNYGPFQSIWLCLQLALYGGLTLGAPFLIFFIAEFVLPALKVNEKRFLYQAAGIGSVLFFAGVAFCYFLIVQVALKASVEFSLWLGFGADEWNAAEYLSFVVKFLLVMGLAFEMPVVLLTIVKIGLLDYPKLTQFRSYFIVGMMVASAVITPSGDPFTMILVAIPLWILYELCVLIARMWYRDAQKAEAAERAREAEEDAAGRP